MNDALYTVETRKSFDDAVAAVERKSLEKGFRVLHTHDVAATLAEKGFPREPMKIVEVCNARLASLVLRDDPRIAVMLPCPIVVYHEKGATHITTMRPTAMLSMFPESGIENVATLVEKTLLEIVNEAKE